MSTTTTWNPMTHEEYDLLLGFDVYSSDNEKLGTIKEVCHPAVSMPAARGEHYFRVEPGMLKKLFSDLDEVFIAETMIRDVRPDDGRVVLNVSKDRIIEHDWDRPHDFDSYRLSKPSAS
jgi:hypothetical protein